MAFIILRYVPSKLILLRDFIINGCPVWSKVSSTPMEIIMIFILQFDNVVYHTE